MQTRSSPSITTLHRLARHANIEGYENLPKTVLFKKLQESFDLERLQRVEARRKKLQEMTKKRSREQESESSSPTIEFKKSKASSAALNKLDPIMLCPIGKKNIWKFVRPNGNMVAFNVDTLIDYILATGDFTDPETRIPFTDKNLQEIDDIATKACLNKKSIVEAKKNPQFFADFIFRRDALQGLERCAGEVITDILHIIETCDPDEAQMRLIMRELPTFADYFKQLKDADSSYARQSILHWLQYLEGPPNKRNEDPFGLIEIVCYFLKMCDSGNTVPSTGHYGSSYSASSSAFTNHNYHTNTSGSTGNNSSSHHDHSSAYSVSTRHTHTTSTTTATTTATSSISSSSSSSTTTTATPTAPSI